MRIALSGGGMRGLAHVGALEVLEERGLLNCVKEYLGTSAGALIAFSVCIGYTLSEMRTLCIALDFSLVQNIDPEVVFNCMESYGFDDGANTEKLLTVLLKAKGIPINITFEEFAERFPNAPRLRVYAVKVSNNRIHEFSLDKTPRTEIKFAVRASMTIPIYFTPMHDISSNELYVDGGLISHFPFHHLTDLEREDTIGIAFKRANAGAPIESMGHYCINLYYSVYDHQNVEIYKTWGHKIIRISCGNFPSFDFGADADQKLGLIEKGREDTILFLESALGRIPVRRYSLP
jgi:predicted acylesterase/phospholipase RssA